MALLVELGRLLRHSPPNTYHCHSEADRAFSYFFANRPSTNNQNDLLVKKRDSLLEDAVYVAAFLLALFEVGDLLVEIEDRPHREFRKGNGEATF